MRLCALTLAILLIAVSFSSAEKIYYKNGKTMEVSVRYLKAGTLWVESNIGLLGIDQQDIAKIENEDGSISKYDVNGIFRRSEEYIFEKRYREAMGMYDSLLKYFPEDTKVHYLYGILNHKIENLEGAIDNYRFLVEHKAADAAILNNIGAIYAKKGEYAQARSWFEKAVEADPYLTEAHSNLAQVSLEMKDYERAIGEYGRVVASEPSDTQALYNLGVAYFYRNEYAKAKEQWEKVLTVSPSDASAKNALEYIKAKGLAAGNTS